MNGWSTTIGLTLAATLSAAAEQTTAEPFRVFDGTLFATSPTITNSEAANRSASTTPLPPPAR